MTILLGATFALLLAAVVLSFQGMNEGVKNAPADELARLRSQVEQLKAEQERFDQERQLQQLRSNPVPETGSPAAATASEMEMMRAQLAAIEAEKAALREEKDMAEKKAATFRDEAGYIGQRELERGDDELRRARLIRDALLIGRVAEYESNPEYGGFAVIEIVMPEHVQIGTILAIRRNTGILGQVKITDISPEGAIGSPMPGFGPVEPQPGDELIIPPQV
jgi:outer membrane murein-binding lipoprotein Lpp